MNVSFKNVRVTLIVIPTDLRASFGRLCSIAENQLGINVLDGKEAVVFLSRSHRLVKIITADAKGTVLITRHLHQGTFQEVLVKSDGPAKIRLTNSELERYLNGEALWVKRRNYW